MRNKYNTSYNRCADAIRAIEALGIYQTRWNNLFHDLSPNQQKLYCRINGKELTLKAEYTDTSALIEVYEAAPFKGISQPAPQYAEEVLAAIRTAYPTAEIVGEKQLIRVII